MKVSVEFFTRLKPVHWIAFSVIAICVTALVIAGVIEWNQVVTFARGLIE